MEPIGFGRGRFWFKSSAAAEYLGLREKPLSGFRSID
jgi:hypothetical protein